MANELWYYEKDGEQIGPISQAELQALIEIGELSRDNLAWKPGERDWSETGSYEVLIPSFKSPPPVRQRAAPPSLPVRDSVPVHAAQEQAEATSTAPEPITPQRQSELDSPQPGSGSLTLSFAKTTVQPPATQPPLPAVIPPPPQEYAQSRPPVAGPSPTSLGPQRPLEPMRRSVFQRFAEALAFVVNVKRLFSWPPERPALQGATLAVIVVAAIIVPQIFPPFPPAAEPVPTSLHGTRVPVGYTGPVGQIKVDAYPWAELTRLSLSGKALDVPGSAATPLVLLVAPGSYRVELGGFVCEVDVAVEASRTCKKVVRTIDSATYYQEVGW